MPNNLSLFFILAIYDIFILLFPLLFSKFLTNTSYLLASNVFTQMNSDQYISAKIWGHGGSIHVDIDAGLESQMDMGIQV